VTTLKTLWDFGLLVARTHILCVTSHLWSMSLAQSGYVPQPRNFELKH